jgi:hypothetical protein
MRLVQSSSILLLSSAIALTACGGSSGDDTGGPEPIDMNGTAHTYVVNRVLLPAMAGQGNKYGLDLDGDGNVDNALGNILSALAGAAGGGGNLNLQGSLDSSVLQAKIVLLANIKATALDTAKGVALEVFIGDPKQVTPAPCDPITDPLMDANCGKHLKGTGMFKLTADSPTDSHVVGKIIGGTFNGGPGDMTVQISLSADVGAPLTLNLIGARAKLSGVSATGVGTDASPGILAGGITKPDLDGRVLPAVHDTLAAQIIRDCYMADGKTPNGPAPGCGCKDKSTGATVLTLFDKPPMQNCDVTLDEIKNSTIIKQLLSPDIMVKDSSGAMTPVLSVGVGVTLTGGMFPVPAGD